MANCVLIDKSLSTKPEVAALAAALEVSVNEAIGMLVRFWGWIDDHQSGNGLSRFCHAGALPLLRDGRVPVTREDGWPIMRGLIDRHVVQHEGFAEALVNVGWLELEEHGARMPKHDHYMTQASRKQALARMRQQRCRARKAEDSSACGGPETVTQPSRARVTRHAAARHASVTQVRDHPIRSDPGSNGSERSGSNSGAKAVRSTRPAAGERTGASRSKRGPDRIPPSADGGRPDSGGSGLPPPTWDHVIPEDLASLPRLDVLFADVVRRGVLGRVTGANHDFLRLMFTAAAEHARRDGERPVKLFCKTVAECGQDPTLWNKRLRTGEVQEAGALLRSYDRTREAL